MEKGATNLEKLDKAIELTLAKFQKLGNVKEYQRQFVDKFIKNGFIPTMITRENGARNFIEDFTTEMVVAEIIKYADRAKAISLEKRYDDALYQNYPFITMFDMSVLNYASTAEDNLKNLIEFFITQRYNDFSNFNKLNTDKDEVFEMCRESSKEIDNYFKISNHQR